MAAPPMGGMRAMRPQTSTRPPTSTCMPVYVESHEEAVASIREQAKNGLQCLDDSDTLSVQPLLLGLKAAEWLASCKCSLNPKVVITMMKALVRVQSLFADGIKAQWSPYMYNLVPMSWGAVYVAVTKIDIDTPKRVDEWVRALKDVHKTLCSVATAKEWARFGRTLFPPYAHSQDLGEDIYSEEEEDEEEKDEEEEEEDKEDEKEKKEKVQEQVCTDEEMYGGKVDAVSQTERVQGRPIGYSCFQGVRTPLYAPTVKSPLAKR